MQFATYANAAEPIGIVTKQRDNQGISAVNSKLGPQLLDFTVADSVILTDGHDFSYAVSNIGYLRPDNKRVMPLHRHDPSDPKLWPMRGIKFFP